MKNYIKKIGAIVLCFAMCISTFCLFTVSSTAAEENAVSKEYPVTEDAYIREEQGDGTYSSETLGTGHSIKYADGKTKILNVKYNTGNPKRNIRTIFKFDLPTKEQANAEGFNKIEFAFTIARVADYLRGNQTYNFYYATNVDWNDETVTWNKIINSIPADDAHLAGSVEVKKGKEYSSLTKEDATVCVDITDLYMSLLTSEAQTLTISVVAAASLDTTLQIHDQTSLDGTYGAKIIASSIDKDALDSLVAECDKLITRYCSDSSVEAFKNALATAKSVGNNEDDIISAYEALEAAKDALKVTKDYLVTQDAFIRSRSDKKGSVNNTEFVEVKRRPSEPNDIIGLMDVNLPTKAEVEKYGYDTFDFTFNFGKSFNEWQDFYFYFVTDIEWDETKATWNNTRALLPSDEEMDKMAYEFIYTTSTAGDATASDVDTTKVSCDVTDSVEKLIENGVEKITVVIWARTDKNASVAFYSSEATDPAKAPRLVASRSAKAPVTTNETLKVESGDYDMHYQTRDGVDGTTDYRLLVVANEDYIKTLESAKIQAVFSNGTVSKTLKVEITVAYTTIEAVDEDGNTTIYTAEDGTVIMGCVVKGVPAGYDIVKDSAEFLPVLAAN